ncbi:hypothetical protein SMD22_01415 (plasmid) [Brevibacillus halotolerans]|nr:hypothetical protein SMD22_01415 [Brevibacillus halotolerans]
MREWAISIVLLFGVVTVVANVCIFVILGTVREESKKDFYHTDTSRTSMNRELQYRYSDIIRRNSQSSASIENSCLSSSSSNFTSSRKRSDEDSRLSSSESDTIAPTFTGFGIGACGSQSDGGSTTSNSEAHSSGCSSHSGDSGDCSS